MEVSPMKALDEDQGPRLRELLGMAAQEAQGLGHHFVGTGHVALAAIRMSVEDEALIVDARSRLEGLLGRGSAEAADPVQPTPRLIRLVEECRAASRTDDAGATDVLTTIRRLEPAVARTVMAE
jgi:hypothetical protein